MKVFLTGASGFLGGHVAHALAARGDELLCLMRSSSQREHLSGLSDSITELEAGLEDSHFETLEEHLEGVEMVVHIAGATKKSRVTRERLFEINEGGTELLLRATLAAAPNLRRFIYVSTMAASGPSRGGELRTETHDPEPISDYGASKLAGERKVLAVADSLPVSILRPPGIIGPRDPMTINLYKLVRRGFRPVGSRRANFVHVTDVAKALLLLGDKDEAVGQVYHIGTENHSLSEMGRILARLLGVRGFPLWLPKSAYFALALAGQAWTAVSGRQAFMDLEKAREFTSSWAVDCQKLRGLGWHPQFNFEQASQAAIDWYREQGML